MPTKEPNTKRDYGFDYSAEVTGDAITASTWTADTGLILTGPTFSATATSVWIEGGTEGETLTATNRITTTAGRTYERVLTLAIRVAVDPADDWLATASDIVRDLAPAPVPSTADYRARAARAERILAAYLKSTRGGAVKSISNPLGSKSYASMPEVQGLVAGTMGSHYTGGAGSGAFTLEVASSYPEPV